jgi:hypothetical protein
MRVIPEMPQPSRNRRNFTSSRSLLAVLVRFDCEGEFRYSNYTGYPNRSAINLRHVPCAPVNGNPPCVVTDLHHTPAEFGSRQSGTPKSFCHSLRFRLGNRFIRPVGMTDARTSRQFRIPWHIGISIYIQLTAEMCAPFIPSNRLIRRGYPGIGFAVHLVSNSLY